MKTYNEFLNENEARGDFNAALPIGFRFSIDFTNATKEQFSEFATEMKKYFIFKNGILTYSATDTKPWAWSFEISVRGERVELEYYPVSFNKSILNDTVAGDNFLKRLVPIDEFLSVGFEGIRNYIKMRQDMNKFNL
jgi:uncharacterized surface anchored protein